MEEIELAMIDEAGDYEVDEAHILYLPATKKFILKTASGCSCWDGEYEYEEFESLKAIEDSLLKDDRTYNPSLSGAKTLLDAAWKKHESLGFEAKPLDRDNKLTAWLTR